MAACPFSARPCARSQGPRIGKCPEAAAVPLAGGEPLVIFAWMFDLLPPLPDAATLAVLPWWIAGGATAGFGAVVFQWLTKPGVFGELVREEPIHIPGAPAPSDPVPVPWGPAGSRAALVGALAAALWAWGWYGPEDTQHRIAIFFALAGLGQSLWELLKVHRDAPTVGEPPSDDPEQALPARLRRALGGLGFAALGVAMAWL
jgi:hypothetical protein